MSNSVTRSSIEFGNRTLTIETGRFAKKANASALVRGGETVVLATVVSAQPREDLDYLPLWVEYKEKYYAGGRISPSRFVKRERRPSDENVLVARLIDRSIRPLFPKGFKNEVQVITTVLSYDNRHSPDMVAAVATSAALAISDIPWDGPIGCVRIGMNAEGDFLVNPLNDELESSPLDLIVTSTAARVLMIEAGASQIEETKLLAALKFGHEQNQVIVEQIKDLASRAGRPKIPVVLPEIPKELSRAVEEFPQAKIDAAIKASVQSEKAGGLEEVEEEIRASLGESVSKSRLSELLRGRFKKRIRAMILEGKRPDGRRLDEIRPLTIEVGVLPRTHGSAVFQRGDTQVLSVATLGAPSLEQWIEGMMGEETKRYIHHYYSPPYSFGEVGRLGWPSRREVGHGALAERALTPVIPEEETFPYAIRVVSEIMTSNGSTSMASVCGSTLSLMDAGVPISDPVAGIAMGLVKEGDREVVLTDIIGLEDFNGDMDFKVVGTEKGVTAIQLDVKIAGLSFATIKETLAQAKKARLFILEKMLGVIDKPRSRVSQYAPKIDVVHIDPEMIGEVIGPGGRVIRQIIAETGASIDVNDEGRVVISAETQEEVEAARKWVEGLTSTVEEGDHFTGTVRRIEPYGIFVEIGPGKEGLVHVSEMSTDYVKDPGRLVKVGDEVDVWVKGFNDRGQISLSMLSEEDREKRTLRSRPSRQKPPSHRKRAGARDYFREALESKH
jgi:polyribonucleotide nucleotidyltransferase